MPEDKPIKTLLTPGDTGEYPCGCKYQVEQDDDGNNLLIINVSPDCKLDSPKIGKVIAGRVYYSASRIFAESASFLKQVIEQNSNA